MPEDPKAPKQIIVEDNYPTCKADEELKNRIKAKFHMIYVVTWEEKRIITSLQDICEDEKINYSGVQVWDSARGLRIPAYAKKEDKGGPVEGGEALNTADDILDFIIKRAEDVQYKKNQIKTSRGPIYVLCDFFRYLTPQALEPQIERKIRVLCSLLKATTIHVVIVSPDLQLPTALEKCVDVLDYPLPGREQLGVMVENARQRLTERKRIDDNTPNEEVVRALQGLTLIEAEDAVAKAIVVTRKFDIPTLHDVKRQIIRKNKLLDYVQNEIGMQEVGGLQGVKEFVKMRKRAFSDAAREYKLPAPKGIFLLGVQGSGKSLAAKGIASELNVPLLKMEMGRMFSSYIGESEGNLKRTLIIAESVAPCVLLVDEIDKALSGSQGSSTDSGTTKRVIAMLLDWMQEKKSPVFIVACANSISDMAAETIRKGRFDELFFVDLPDETARQEIFQIHIRKVGRDPAKFDLDSLVKATDNFSGAEIEAAVVDSMYAAFAETREFTTKDVLRSTKSTKPLATVMKEQIDALRQLAIDRSMRRANEPYYKPDEDPQSAGSRFDSIIGLEEPKNAK